MKLYVSKLGILITEYNNEKAAVTSDDLTITTEGNVIKLGTKDDTKVTTTSITDERASILIDQFTFNEPEFIQVKTFKLFI